MKIIKNKRLYNKINIDPILMLLLTILIGFGLIVMESASGQDPILMKKQIIRVALSVIAMMVVAQINPDRLKAWAFPIYIVGVLSLICVSLFGEVNKGAQRWLYLGSIKFQPSEIMKVVFPICISWYISKQSMPISTKNFIIGCIIMAIPAILIGRQPDLGTSILMTSSGLFVLFMSGLSWGVIATGIISLIPITYVLWEYLMHDYQRQRVLTLFDPEADPLGSSYHIIQSKIAIGSGGLTGKGWMKGTQSQLDFLPERHTDFVFAVIGEEFGFIGAVLLLAAYMAIIIRGIFIAINASNNFLRLLAGSITMTFFVYIFVNIAMVSGTIPVVGVPLPLISYGGTSMITIMIGFGILMSISSRKKWSLNE